MLLALLLIGSTGIHSAADPLIRCIEILLALTGVRAVKICASAIHEIQVLHGIVVGGVDLNSMREFGDAVVHKGRVVGDERTAAGGAHASVAIAIVLKGLVSESLDGELIGIGPFDNADRVMRFGIFGVGRNDLALGRDGLVESFDVALNGSDLTENVEVLRIGAEELVELFKRANRYREVLRRVKVGNDLIGERGCEVQVRRRQVGSASAAAWKLREASS